MDNFCKIKLNPKLSTSPFWWPSSKPLRNVTHDSPDAAFFVKPKAKSNYFVFWRWSWRKCFSLSLCFPHPHINCDDINHITISLFISFYRFSFSHSLMMFYVSSTRITNSKKWNSKPNCTKKRRHVWWEHFHPGTTQRRNVWNLCGGIPNACNNHHKKRIKIICTFKINFKLETNFMSNFPAKFSCTVERSHKINDCKRTNEFIISCPSREILFS